MRFPKSLFFLFCLFIIGNRLTAYKVTDDKEIEENSETPNEFSDEFNIDDEAAEADDNNSDDDDEDDNSENWLTPADSSDEFIDETENAEIDGNKVNSLIPVDFPNEFTDESENTEMEAQRYENDPRPFWGGRRRRSRSSLFHRATRGISRVLRRTIRHPVRIFRRTIRRTGRFFRRTIRRIGRFVRRTIRHPGRIIRRTVRHFRWVVKKISGIPKLIGSNQIGKIFGKATKSLFKFLKCAVPGVESITGCVKDAIKSIGSCSGSSCSMKIGGRRSSCLRIASTQQYQKTYGVITVSGKIDSQLGLGLQVFFNTGKMKISLYGHVSINAKARIYVPRAVSKQYQKRIPLTKTPKTVFQKLIVVAIGKIPVPVLMEIKFQPVVRLNLKADASVSLDVSAWLEKAARIALEHATIEYDPKLGKPKFSNKFVQNMNNLRIKKSIIIKGRVTLTGTISVGLEITVSMNGVPIKIFPSVELKLVGTVSASVSTSNGACISGSLTLGINLKVLIIPDVRKLTSVSQNFKGACSRLASLTCHLPGLRIAGCFSSKFNPCQKMKEGCSEISNLLKKIPNPIQNNPILANFYLYKSSLLPLYEGKKCTHVSPRRHTVNRRRFGYNQRRRYVRYSRRRRYATYRRRFAYNRRRRYVTYSRRRRWRWGKK